MKRLVVVTDMGTFKAYSVEEDRLASTPRLQPIHGFEQVRVHEKLNEQLSDQSIQKSKGTPSSNLNDTYNDDRHNVHLENRRRSLKEIADAMNKLLANGEFDSCYLAAPKEMNNQLVESLSAPVRKKIEKNVPLDLVNLDKNQILQHFN